jgi:uncharacterized protein
MKTLKSFTIHFASLADGEHFFDYHIDNKFLKHFEATLVHEANLDVKLHLVKFLANLEFNFTIRGTVRVPCDICVEEFDLPIEGEETVMVKVIQEIPEDSDEFNVIFVDESTHSINVAEMLYELMTLSIPMRKVHPKAKKGVTGCDPKVLKYLKESEDNATANNATANNTNPIWDELKKLK